MGTLSIILLVIFVAAFTMWKLLKWKKSGTLKENMVKYVTDMYEGFENFHIMTTEQKEKMLSLLSVDQLNSILMHIKFGNFDQIERFTKSITPHLNSQNSLTIVSKLAQIFQNAIISIKENGTFWVVKYKNFGKTDFVFIIKEDEKFDHTDMLNLAISYSFALKDAHIKNTVSVKIFEVKGDGELRICKTYTPRELTKFVVRMLAANPNLLLRKDAE